jgi:hypothetical protein
MLYVEWNRNGDRRRSRSRSPRRGGGGRGGRSRSRSRDRRHNTSSNKSNGSSSNGDRQNNGPDMNDLRVSGADAYARRVAMSRGGGGGGGGGGGLQQGGAGRGGPPRDDRSSGGGGGGRGPRDFGNEPLPQLYSIHKGIVKTIKPFGCFVAMDGNFHLIWTGLGCFAQFIVCYCCHE